MNDERRHEERVRHPRITASCTRLEWIYPEGAPNLAHTLLDVSTGGARLIVNKPLKEGEPVTVRLDALRQDRAVMVAGEVRWLSPLPSLQGSAPTYIAGVRFHRAPGLLELLGSA